MSETPRLRVAVAQMTSVLGDVEANLDRVADYVVRAEGQGVDLLVFPELALSGYPVGPWFSDAAVKPGSEVMERLKRLSCRVAISIGIIEETEDVQFYNSAVFLSGGRIRHVHRKVYPPNYKIFDEARYFGRGRTVAAFDTPWCRMAMLICGDCWHLTLPYMAVHDGADVLIVLAASSREGLSHTVSCQDAWERMNRSYALTLSSFVVFANHVGEASGLQFWGGSHIVKPDGNFAAQASLEEPQLLVMDLDLSMLRNHRLVLPFRRDDQLDITLRIGHNVLHNKTLRRDGLITAAHPVAEPARRGGPHREKQRTSKMSE